jgi:cobalt-zinc-cadmium efflux system membrane fusion protein
MKYIWPVAVATTLLCACGGRTATEPAAGNRFTIEGEHVIVAGNAPELQHISIEEAGLASRRVTVEASAVVKAAPARYAEIASPFAGRIIRSLVRLGQKVEAGEPLFEMHSPAFQELGKAFLQARQEMELARKNLDRERDLNGRGIGSARSLEEAETAFELRRSDYEQAAGALGAYRISLEDVEPGSPFVVRSPIAGEVVKERILTGQYVRDDAEAQAIVADLSEVLVTAYVKEKDLPYVDGRASVEIRLIALPDAVASGRIVHIGDILDPDTRSAEVVIECGNPGVKMKPFMYGTVIFSGLMSETVCLPASAVLQDEGSRYVMVSEGERRFRKAPVALMPGGGNADSVGIVSGVSRGDKVVTQGAFYFINAR